MKYRNPIIPGYQPDPSVCRVGNDYYLVNSSFEFFPGVPLFHSRDLVNWKQIGHVLTRKSQLPLQGSGTSGGIFAPTIRYHDGRFYMITTNITGGGNFLVWTDDIDGEWSDPVWIDHMGIDPSLFWDDDGRVYYQGTGFTPEGKQGIVQFRLDPMTGQKLSEPKCIWYGTGGKCPEGPHMYKIQGKYYLMIAEGGTEYGHMETVARADSVWGPFESCPRNPILTHRDISPSFNSRGEPSASDFQGLGHADLVEDGSGNWWLVFHGIRPSRGMLHHIGRETMLAPVTWEDGWPVVNGGAPISPVMEVPDTGAELLPDGFALQADPSLETDFSGSRPLSPRWAFLRDVREDCYECGDGLCLRSSGDLLDGDGSPTFLGVRQARFDTVTETVLSFSPADGEEAGITVFHTCEHHYDLIVTRKEGKRAAVLRRRAADLTAESAPVFLPETGNVRLRIVSDRLHYEFFAGPDGEEPAFVGQGRSQLLSTEVTFGTFTGCFLGLFCQGKAGAEAKFRLFRCRQ